MQHHQKITTWFFDLRVQAVLKYLANAQNFQFEIFNTLDPPFSIIGHRILEKPKIENFSDDVFKLFPGVSAMDTDKNTEAATLKKGADDLPLRDLLHNITPFC